MMNPSRLQTTTEINTEIKYEVKLETSAFIQVGKQSDVQNRLEAAPAGLTENKQIEDEPIKMENAAKHRDAIKAEREARKLAKQAKKMKGNNKQPVMELTNGKAEEILNPTNAKSKPTIKEDTSKTLVNVTEQLNKCHLSEETPAVNKVQNNHELVISKGNLAEKKKATTKAERRALQEAQRAAKAKVQAEKSAPAAKQNAKANASSNPPNVKPQTKRVEQTSAPASVPQRSTSMSPVKTLRFNDGYVKLFSHLERSNKEINLFVNNAQIRPSIARLGEQYAKRIVVGSNARCIGFLNAIKTVIQDFETPPKKEFIRSLEAFIKCCVDYLHQCRPLAVSVNNAHKHINQLLMQLSSEQPESELKEKLCSFIDTYVENQIGKAAQAINSMMQKKINDGDVILTFGCSSLINFILEQAKVRKIKFRVIVVDSRPFCEGQELLRRLTAKDISCTYVLINAISYVMPEVTKVLMGAHALLANGYVMSRTGTAQVALVARSFNVPVLVCCETHKFSERFQTDAIVYNELGDPDDIIVDSKCCLTNWQKNKHKISPLNLNYDITPPELVTAVITEVSVLPCTSVPVILRMKSDWLVYAN